MTHSVLDGLPKNLTPFIRAAEVKRCAASIGFDWTDVNRLLDHAADELREIREAVATGDRDAIADEMGDLLFVIANLARFTNTNAEEALSLAINKFERRFRRLETLMIAQQRAPGTADLAALWREAKQTS